MFPYPEEQPQLIDAPTPMKPVNMTSSLAFLMIHESSPQVITWWPWIVVQHYSYRIYVVG